MAGKSFIDHETVQRIIDSAKIEEVVRDFVSLKRRGANYVGLCPFHNERTPSFSVSPARNICKCFSCGKGGSPVNFIMEHEQMTYWEALRYLASKYNIQIKERELSDEERRQQGERQSMLALNEVAMKHFESRMAETDEGRDVGLSYFRHRGINDAAIKKFHLGFALETRDDFAEVALKAGFKPEIIEAVGLSKRYEHGWSDRFRGRVIYPVFTISGKPVAFGGRILTNDKKLAKYVNSPESTIYSKSRELYGLFQAKQSIVRKDKCILVEGYMDVISMSQRGIENVVASSGTSLTTGQIRLIHRFTDNVTVIYDSDAAGIKASIRGIDLLLAEGMNIKVLLLPDGEDPDSYAQSHTAEEVEAYLTEHEQDFIRFKTDILLKNTAGDPVAKAKAISSIVASIAVIPDEITRNVYIRECATRFEMDDTVLARQLAAIRTKRLERLADEQRRQAARDSISNPPGGIPAGEQPQTPVQSSAAVPPAAGGAVAAPPSEPQEVLIDPSIVASTPVAPVSTGTAEHRAVVLKPQERSLLRLVLRYGMLDLGEDYGADENGAPIKVIDYVIEDLEQDDLTFENPDYRIVYEEAVRLRDTEWAEAWTAAVALAEQQKVEQTRAGREAIAREAQTMDAIRQRELSLEEAVNAAYQKSLRDFAKDFFSRRLLSHPDDRIRIVATDLLTDRHHLSKIYFKNNTKVETEEDRLNDLIPRTLLELKYDIARCLFQDLSRKIQAIQSQPDYDLDEILDLMAQQRRWQQFSADLATKIGERVYEPLR